MIRRRDQWRLSVQKLGLRKRRAAFAIVSVALGVIVVVTVNSLLGGVREVVLRTMRTEDLHKDAIKVFTTGNPYEFRGPSETERQAKTKKRYQFLTAAAFEEMRAWPEVEAADHPVAAHTLSLSAFTNTPRVVTGVRGVPVALLRRYVDSPARLAACTNVIPLVVGERYVRARFDEKSRKVELDKTLVLGPWLGRDVTLRLGDNYVMEHYRYDYEKHQFQVVSAEDQAAQRETLKRSLTSQYDMTIYGRMLPLKARIVGVCPGGDCLIPLDTARQCEKWLDQRRRLAVLVPARETNETVYETRGRSTPRAGEFTEGLVLVKPGTNTEPVAKRIEEMGFYVTTRARAFESQVKEFDNALKIVKRILFGFGGVIIGLACGLVWSTTSRVVSDSRADIGLFRALGATKADIRRLFLTEAMLLGVLGTLVGIFLGWALAGGISHWAISFAKKQVSDPEEMLLIPQTVFAFRLVFCLALVALTAAVSFLSGLVPARRAANIDPVKALKRE